MAEITNEDRAAWAATAIDAFTAECRMDGEDNQTKAKDLATNLVHYLRLECGLSLEEAGNVIHNAVGMAEQEAEEDSDGGDDEDGEPIERTYGVRLWATFRGECETSVQAFSFAEAVEKAKALDHSDFNFTFDDSVEGDETTHVFGPDDDDRESIDAWEGDGVELDKRAEGEPFSWLAVQLVKDLAQLNPVAEMLPADDPILTLINRAKALCAKET